MRTLDAPIRCVTFPTVKDFVTHPEGFGSFGMIFELSSNDCEKAREREGERDGKEEEEEEGEEGESAERVEEGSEKEMDGDVICRSVGVYTLALTMSRDRNISVIEVSNQLFERFYVI